VTLVDAREPGVFTAGTPEHRLRVVVNALDPNLTLLNTTPIADAAQALPQPRATRLRTDPWVLLLIAAVGLLCLEWVTFHRRVTI
jgi:hypothetical protein